jgi:virginiamycin B lyase
MRISAIACLTGPALLAAIGIAAPPAAAQDVAVEVEEWTVPWPETRPRDPYVAPDGRVWFVGQRADYAAVFDPETEEFERFDLGEGTGPHNLVVAEDGMVWFAGNRQMHVGVLDPASGMIERIRMPREEARDPHTLVFAPDEAAIWFTVQGGNFVGRVDPETRKVDLVQVPTPDARPYGIDVDSDGRPWFVEFAAGKIATLDPATLELTEFPLPWNDGRPRRIVVDSKGDLWYVDYARGELGRMTPEGEFETWGAPAGASSRPYALGIDDLDRLWYVETGPSPNQLVGFDSRTERVISVTPIPSGAGAVRHMYFDPDERALWFGTDANTLARVRVPAAMPAS